MTRYYMQCCRVSSHRIVCSRVGPYSRYNFLYNFVYKLRYIFKIALLIIINSHNSHTMPMLINYSNFSFVGIGGDFASSLGGRRKTNFVAPNLRMTFFYKIVDLMPENLWIPF